MKTLYLRNVPDEVVERLKRLADREAVSLNKLAVKELAEASRRVDNAALVAGLPDHAVDPLDLVVDLEADRAGR